MNLFSRHELRKIYKKEGDFLKEVFPVLKLVTGIYPVDIFFMDVIGVTPPNSRPVSSNNNDNLIFSSCERCN